MSQIGNLPPSRGENKQIFETTTQFYVVPCCFLFVPKSNDAKHGFFGGDEFAPKKHPSQNQTSITKTPKAFRLPSAQFLRLKTMPTWALLGVFKPSLPPISVWLGWKQSPFGQVFHNFRAYQNPIFVLKVIIFLGGRGPPQCWDIPMFKVISMKIFLASSFPTPPWLCSQRCWKSFPCHCSHLLE